MNWLLSETLKQLMNFADICADAYVNQFIDPNGLKVVGNPLVYHNDKTGNFDWTCDRIPLADNVIAPTIIFEGIYGEVGTNPEIARYIIVDSIMSVLDLHTLADKIGS